MPIASTRRRLPLVAAGVLALAALGLLWRTTWDHRPDEGRRPESSPTQGAQLEAPVLDGVARAAPPIPKPATPAPGAFEPDEAQRPRFPLRVSAFDVASGRPVRGTWNPRAEPATVAPYSEEQVRDPETFARVQEQKAREAIECERDWEGRFVPLGEHCAERFSAGELLRRKLGLRPAEGWIPVRPSMELLAHGAADAVEAVASLPVAREAPLEVVVTGPDGRAAEGVSIQQVRLAEHVWPVRVETAGPGRLRVYGLPHLPGEPVALHLAWAGPAASVPASGPQEIAEEEIEDEAAPDVKATLPESLAEPWRVQVQLQGPVLERPFFDLSFNWEETEEVQGRCSGPFGRVRARALSWDGQPLAGAVVSGVEVGIGGEALIPDLEPGRRTLLLHAPGRLMAVGEVDVVAEQEATLTLREPRGGRLEVLVVDPEGRPRPGAQLTLDVPWFDVVDGVQRMDSWCDERGRRSIERVQPGPCRVKADTCSRHGEASVTLHDEETARVTIVVR